MRGFFCPHICAVPYPRPTAADVVHAHACAEVLHPLVTEARLAKLEQVVAQRTRHISVVLENVYQSRNASAVMRSADGLGLLDVHLIENDNAWSRNKGVAKGASQWLNLHRYLQAPDPRLACVESIKSKGIQLVVTSPHAKGFTPETLPLDKPVALVMGTEFSGASDFMMSHADAFIEIPMHGFAESFNISVAAAILMNRLRGRLEASSLPWQLHEDEQAVLNAEWIYKSVRRARSILARHGLTPPPTLLP